ncbi:MAG: BatA and WFA domain-containing protein [Bacteroidota bacterium]|nr:BatA and WFA domain-containing protein [Bacteroidota bacterium]
MSFTYPAFLIALSAIAIPVIIHLFNFRKFKTVYFSNVRFLKEVQEETQAKSKLKHLLVLAARILAIAFLVLAFAQPFIPVDNAKVITGDKAVSIFIDNSFSMDAVNKNGTLLEDAKKRATEIVAAYKASDRFQLLTNDFEGKHQRLVNKEEFFELLDEVKISPATRDLREIVSRQTDLLKQNEAKVRNSFILSDFQKSISTLEAIKNDTSIRFHLIPLESAAKSNVYIDTCWFESPVRQFSQLEKLHVRIRNVSDKNLENNSIKLFINGIQKTPASFSVENNSETEVILSFSSKEAGIQHCSIELNDYPVTFDDKFYFSFEVEKNIPVLSINSTTSETDLSGSYINKLYGADSLFVLTNAEENKLDYSVLGKNRLVVMNGLKSISSGLAQELRKFLENGGSILVFPGKDADLPSYKEFLLSVKSNFYEKQDTVNTKVEKINLEHPVYNDVFDKKTFSASNLDLPKVSSHYVMSRLTRNNEEYLLRLQNGDAFLSKYDVGKGKLYVCASGLTDEFSNFARHGIFVPTLYKIGMYSQRSSRLFYIIGKEEIIESDIRLSGENVFHIKDLKKEFDVIPEHKVLEMKTAIMIHNQVQQAGNYELSAGVEKPTGISFNFNRLESNLNAFTHDELSQKIEQFNLFNFNVLSLSENSLTNSLSELDQGKKLWKICLVLALLFLGAEVLLLRFMKG